MQKPLESPPTLSTFRGTGLRPSHRNGWNKTERLGSGSGLWRRSRWYLPARHTQGVIQDVTGSYPRLQVGTRRPVRYTVHVLTQVAPFHVENGLRAFLHPITDTGTGVPSSSTLKEQSLGTLGDKTRGSTHPDPLDKGQGEVSHRTPGSENFVTKEGEKGTKGLDQLDRELLLLPRSPRSLVLWDRGDGPRWGTGDDG